MTTSKPEVVAYSWQCHGRHSTVDKKFADELVADGEGVDPLIRLSDYEALQAQTWLLVEALERISNMDSMSYHSLESAKIVARKALDTHRNQGSEQGGNDV